MVVHMGKVLKLGLMKKNSLINIKFIKVHGYKVVWKGMVNC